MIWDTVVQNLEFVYLKMTWNCSKKYKMVAGAQFIACLETAISRMHSTVWKYHTDSI